MPDPVHLLLSWRWDCPSCHARNYHDGCKHMPDDVRREAVAHLGGDPEDPAHLAQMVAQPELVVCRACGAEFPVADEDAAQDTGPDHA